MKTILALALLALSGCVVLPDTVAPEFEHMSHATQHAPLTSAPTNYGSEILNVTAEWNFGKHFYLDLSEGVDLDKRWTSTTTPVYGEIVGPREQFTGRLGYRFTVPK